MMSMSLCVQIITSAVMMQCSRLVSLPTDEEQGKKKKKKEKRKEKEKEKKKEMQMIRDGYSAITQLFS